MTVAGLLAAARLTGTKLSEQRIAILGAGSSAVGISDQIVAAIAAEGVATDEAKKSIWLIDSRGLVHDKRLAPEPFKQKYAQSFEGTAGWTLDEPGRIAFADVVRNLHPTILIGTSAQPGVFTEAIVREMASHVERPIIFPLSNPTSKSEAVPADLINWTEGRALIATGSPFPPVAYDGREIRIGQCNNSFIFPGVGLGVIASGARRVTDAMFAAAARVLSDFSPALHDPEGALYPALERVRTVSKAVALAVAAEAQKSGLAPATTETDLEQKVARKMWQLDY